MPASNPREVQIKACLPHQREDDLAPQRFKVLRWGRRAGKSVFEIKASIVGHGPVQPDGLPKFQGVMHGWAVAWLAPDYKQATNLWEVEIKPRFLNKDGVKIKNDSPYSVEFLKPDGTVYSGLYVYSNENVDAMRGLGNRLIGVVFEEAAHMNLSYAWAEIVRPLLMDNGGWAIFGSSTNAGLDGNPEKIAPSFFNRICTEIMSRKRPKEEWHHSHKTARDNPKIKPEEFESARAEVALGGAVAVAQEMEAELLAAGAGIAFPEWHAAYHVLAPDTVLPQGWPWFGGLDWGYQDPGCFVLLCAGAERQVIVRADYRFQQMRAYEVGREIGLLCRRYGVPQHIAYDSSTDDTYRLGGFAASAELARGLKDVLGPEAPALIPTVKEGRGGKTFRQTRKILLHEMLAWTAPPEGKPLEPWQRPRLVFHPDAAECIGSIPVLPLDPKDPEDVDTHYPADHPYDGLTYALIGPIPWAKGDEPRLDRNRFYGYENGTKLKPWKVAVEAPTSHYQNVMGSRRDRAREMERS